VSGREGDQPNLRRRSGRSGPPRVEERPSCLVRDERRERREDAGLVAHDERGVDTGQLGHGGEEPVPEREGVARVKPAVAKLVDRVDPDVVEGLQLSHPREVEQCVPVHRSREPPERDSEHRPAREHEQRREPVT